MMVESTTAERSRPPQRLIWLVALVSWLLAMASVAYAGRPNEWANLVAASAFYVAVFYVPFLLLVYHGD